MWFQGPGELISTVRAECVCGAGAGKGACQETLGRRRDSLGAVEAPASTALPVSVPLPQAVLCPPPVWPARPRGLLRPVTLWKRWSSWDHISRFSREAGSGIAVILTVLFAPPRSPLCPTPASPTTRITALKVWDFAKLWPHTSLSYNAHHSL